MSVTVAPTVIHCTFPKVTRGLDQAVAKQEHSGGVSPKFFVSQSLLRLENFV